MGNDLYTFNDPLTNLFRDHVKRSWLPLASNTQGVEARIKDVSLRKSTRKHEYTVTNLGTVRSVAVSEVTKKTWRDPDFINCPRKSVNRKEYLPGKVYNKNILNHATTFYTDKNNLNIDDLSYMNNLLKRNNQYSEVRVMEAVEKFKNAKESRRRSIAPSADITVTRSPLMLGKVPFGCPTNKYIPLYQAELRWLKQ